LRQVSPAWQSLSSQHQEVGMQDPPLQASHGRQPLGPLQLLTVLKRRTVDSSIICDLRTCTGQQRLNVISRPSASNWKMLLSGLA
jgi:hypothetical protein